MGRAAAGGSASGTPEEGSMESAKEDGILALEDAQDALVPVTAMVLAQGPPTTYGPQRGGEAAGKERVRAPSRCR